MTNTITSNNSNLEDAVAKSALLDDLVESDKKLPKPEQVAELRDDAIRLLNNLEQFGLYLNNLDDDGVELDNYNYSEIKTILNKVQEGVEMLERETDGVVSRAKLYRASDFNLAVGNRVNNYVVDYDYSNDSANINVLLIAEQVAIAVMKGNSAAAKVTAEAAELLNRVLSTLSALSEIFAIINEMYGTSLTAKQKKEIQNGTSGGSVSNTISWEEVVKNAFNGKKSETPYILATFRETGVDSPKLRQGFLIKSSSNLLGMVAGMYSGGLYDYVDNNNVFKVDISGEELSNDGYLFIDEKVMKSLITYTSQLVALAVPSSSGSTDGDLVANFGDAWKNNITIGSIIDACSNSTKQVNGIISQLASQTGVFQANAQSGGSPFDMFLQSVRSNLNMLGA